MVLSFCGYDRFFRLMGRSHAFIPGQGVYAGERFRRFWFSQSPAPERRFTKGIHEEPVFEYRETDQRADQQI